MQMLQLYKEEGKKMGTRYPSLIIAELLNISLSWEAYSKL